MTEAIKLYFVENLTLRAWFWSIWPRLFAGWLRRNRGSARCYVYNGSAPAMWLARLTTVGISVDIQPMYFRMVDVRDEQDLMLRLRIEYADIFQMQEYAAAEPAFEKLLRSGSLYDRLPFFLIKSLGAGTRFNPETLWSTMYLIQACVWRAKADQGLDTAPVLFLGRRPWFKALVQYSAGYGMTVIPVTPSLDVSRNLRRHLPTSIRTILRTIRARRVQGTLFQLRRIQTKIEGVTSGGTFAETSPRQPHSIEQGQQPKIVVDYYGQMNLNEPHLHSDLGYWEQSSLGGDDLLISFSLPRDPLDEKKLAELNEHGIHYVVTDPAAVSVPGLPVFKGRERTGRSKLKKALAQSRGPEGKWLNQRIQDYEARRAFWTELFEAHNGKIYASFNKPDPALCSIADALRDLGGVLAIFQRSYESHPTPQTSVSAELVFNFSNWTAEVEQLSSSVIPYHVATGYLGDHRFNLLRARSGSIRSSMKQNGARRILAYFDENSADDERLHSGHRFMQENYDFLLGKVLAEPWLGLVMKPKNPDTLRRRLGPVAPLLEEAETTGRAYVYEGGAVQGSHSPAEAAMEADLVVQGHLCAGTAGIESALAGVPTLLMDREWWPVSPLYQLPVGVVVFQQWPDLWKACLEHWDSPSGTPGFGDWTTILDELDPFRDGKASERMGTYLQWILQGFSAGLDRNTNLADAAERYCREWGYDKVTQINSDLLPGQIISPKPTLEMVWRPKEWESGIAR